MNNFTKIDSTLIKTVHIKKDDKDYFVHLRQGEVICIICREKVSKNEDRFYGYEHYKVDALSSINNAHVESIELNDDSELYIDCHEGKNGMMAAFYNMKNGDFIDYLKGRYLISVSSAKDFKVDWNEE